MTGSRTSGGVSRRRGRGAALAAALLAAALLATPQTAPARSPGGGHGGSGGGRVVVVDRLPRGYHTARYNNGPYYYHGGYYFRPHGPGYARVYPPLGLVVSLLPPGYITLAVGGVTYYNYLDVYYRRAPEGFVVVAAPPVAPAPVPAPVAALSSVVVTSQALNVRQGPGGEYPVVAVVQQGATLAVQAASPGWLYVQLYDGRFGWVDRRFTAPAAATPSG